MNETCKDCKYYQNGKCPEEDEDGEVCEKFEQIKEEE